jgi:hypothetical protein
MTTTWRRSLRGVIVSLAILLLGWPALLASAVDQVAFTISDSRVTASSGLIRDPRAHLYWTVNDSGAEGTVYGLTRDGFVRGIIGFHTRPNDVEAVTMSGRRLYVADIGDSHSRRHFVTVYYVDNPHADNKTVPYRSYDFSYPDGAHDAKTLLVDGHGRLFLVTKGLKGGIYVAPKKPSRSGVNRLKRVANAPAYVTDGVFLPDGKRIALRTYVSVEVLDSTSYQLVASAATPFQKEGESVAVSLDGRSLLVGSKGKRSQVMQMAIPTTLGPAPSAGNTPPKTRPPSPSASPSSSGDPAAQDEPTDVPDTGGSTSRTGTILALTLAGFVALVAGLVVAAARKR